MSARPGESKILVIDASLQGVSMAVVDPAAPVGQRGLWYGAHTENMGAVAAIARLGSAALAAAASPAAPLQPAQLAGLVVAVGPGSFTGIKVGLAFAYGLRAAAPSLPMLGLSAIDAAAAELAGDGFGGPLALFVPATRTHGYWALATGASPSPARPATAALIEVGVAGNAALAALPPETRLVVSGRWPLLTEMIKNSGRSVLERAPSDVCRRGICGMAEQAAALWPGAYGQELPPPRYLRLSTAEERLITQVEG